MGDISLGEIVVILVVGLILFGPNKIPEFARQCGKAVNMFKKGLKEGLNDESPASTDAASTAKDVTPEEAKKPESLPHQS